MRRLIADVYESYAGDGEWHRTRIACIVLASLSIAFFGRDLGDSALPAMALAISVLAGFTFTALFSGHLFATSDLPAPKNETDRHNIARLKKLSENFRVRSRFFLILSVVVLVLVIVLSVDISVDQKSIFKLVFPDRFVDNAKIIWSYMSSIKSALGYLLVFSAFFIFFECLYTFYRLSETALSMVDTRREYLEGNAG